MNSTCDSLVHDAIACVPVPFRLLRLLLISIMALFAAAQPGAGATAKERKPREMLQDRDNLATLLLNPTGRAPISTAALDQLWDTVPLSPEQMENTIGIFYLLMMSWIYMFF